MVHSLTCCTCGVEFAMSSSLYDFRRCDHKTFYCPNGHGQVFHGKTEHEKEIERLTRELREWRGFHDDLYQQREHLIAALKECPVPGCSWRSRRQVPRDDVNMGRGIERVHHDLLEHLVIEHAGRVPEARQLIAG